MVVSSRVESVWEAADRLTVLLHNEAEPACCEEEQKGSLFTARGRGYMFWEETLTGAQGTRRAS